MKNINDILVARTPLKKVKIRSDKQPALFKPDFSLLSDMRCPICTRKLLWNIKKTFVYCRKKNHKYMATKQTYEDIVSGKRLKDWQETDRLNRR